MLSAYTRYFEKKRRIRCIQFGIERRKGPAVSNRSSSELYTQVKLIKRRSAAISFKLNHVCMRHVYKFAWAKCDVGQKCGCESSLMRIESI